MLPQVFIGSSSEGHRVAEYLQLGLESCAECTVWSQGVFGLSGSTLESLCATARKFDYAVLVLTPDDMVHKRGAVSMQPRDNVLFELGLFMGALGRDATFIVHNADDRLDLPSDLAGITTARWRTRSDGNVRAAVGPVCTQIREAIESRPPPETRVSVADVEMLRETLQAQSRDFRMLVEALNRGVGLRAPVSPGDDSIEGLRFLEGTWRNMDPGTFAYPRIIDGVLRWPYCHGGNTHLTGEYHQVVRVGNVLTSSFRWLEGSGISGFVYLEIVSPNKLVGGWWYSEDLKEEDLRKLVQFEGLVPIRGMVPVSYFREKPGPIPKWANQYYDSFRPA